jgi:hypothetical protein
MLHIALIAICAIVVEARPSSSTTTDAPEQIIDTMGVQVSEDSNNLADTQAKDGSIAVAARLFSTTTTTDGPEPLDLSITSKPVNTEDVEEHYFENDHHAKSDEQSSQYRMPYVLAGASALVLVAVAVVVARRRQQQGKEVNMLDTLVVNNLDDGVSAVQQSNC